LEGIILLWSLFLSISATFALTRSIWFSILFGLIFQLWIFTITIFPAVF
jgi:hypothetical protein